MNIVVGITTENEPIIIRDPYPLVDVPAYYVEALYLGKPYDKADRKMSDEKKGGHACHILCAIRIQEH